MSKKEAKEPSLHDWLSLGEIERALSKKSERNEDLLRLPVLLRLLAASQPLASVPYILGDEEDQKGEELSPDPVINEVVSRLEDVAATYSAAESVDALVSYLAPSVTRKICKLPPLKRVYSSGGRVRKRKWDGIWDTQELALVAAAPVGTGPRKRKRKSELSPELDGAESADELAANEAEEDEDMDNLEITTHEELSKHSRKSISTPADAGQGSDSFLVGAAVIAEDSQESMVVKALSEIASLVVASLEPVTSIHDEDGEKSKARIALPIMSDSLLSDNVGAIGGSDLGATIAGLMHYAPVLRHRHVANALCRVAAPQTPGLIARMAANCPAVSPCLVRGCLDAYQSSHESSSSSSQGNHDPIINVATAAVRAVARLSQREAARVAATLQQSGGAMIDLQLELTLPDATSTALLLIEHLSELSPAAARDVSHSESRQPASHAMSETPGSLSRRVTAHPPPKSYQIPRLHQQLKDNGALVKKAYACLLDELSTLFKDRKSDTLPWGRVALLLRSYACLMLRVGLVKEGLTENNLSKNKVIVAFASVLDLASDKLSSMSDTGKSIPPESEMDRSVQLLLCSSIATCCRLPPSAPPEDTDAPKEWMKRLERIMTLSVSRRSEVFVTRIAGFLKSKSFVALCRVIIDTFLGNPSLARNQVPVDAEFESRMEATCAWSIEHLQLEPTIYSDASDPVTIEDVSALVESIECGTAEASKVQTALQSILGDSSMCKSLIHKEGVCDLIEAAVSMLARDSKSKIPLILQIKLETLGGKVCWPQHMGEVESFHDLGYQFLLQLLYCLHFLDEQPDSPFAIDPLSLPLAEAVFVCDAFSESSIHPPLKRLSYALRELLYKHCPEVASSTKCAASSTLWGHISGAHLPENVNRRKTLQMLSSSIQYCFADHPGEYSGAVAERIFLLARTKVFSTDVDITAARALLTPRNSPLPYFSYTSLCRDPLTLLKCPIAVWKCRGLRRITLFILNRLLDANDHLIVKKSHTKDSASELIAARNVIIVRCLLIATSGASSIEDSEKKKNGVNPLHCSMIMGTIRSLVARQRGLVAMLVKQGIPDIAVDWLIEFVPETVNDAMALRMLLSERSSLTAAERLTTADASLRIAIAHGSAENNEAQSLAYAAVSTMVTSFFLVIGPVGVPVNCICEEGGPDVTQVCRKALFRMLNALQKVNGLNQGVRNESIMALQKIAALCKGENVMSGVGGTVAARRKSLLKDIWDAVVKAINAMGGGAQI